MNFEVCNPFYDLLIRQNNSETVALISLPMESGMRLTAAQSNAINASSDPILKHHTQVTSDNCSSLTVQVIKSTDLRFRSRV